MKMKNSLKLLIWVELILLIAVLVYSLFFGRMKTVIFGRETSETQQVTETEDVDVEDAVTKILDDGDQNDTQNDTQTDADQNTADETQNGQE